MRTKSLQDLIEGCIIQNRQSQKELYMKYYAFSMGLCLRYSSERKEAVKNLNAGFLLIFDQLSQYEETTSFDQWLKMILIGIFIKKSYTGIHKILCNNPDPMKSVNNAFFFGGLNYQDLLPVLQQLPQSLRTFFNMYALDHYTLQQLSVIFMIDHERSRAILSEARFRLIKNLQAVVSNPPGIKTDNIY